MHIQGKIILLISLALYFTVPVLPGQTWYRADSVSFIENGQTLKNPYAGGLDNPQLSKIDLNNDGISDVFLFDRQGKMIVPFLNAGTTGTVKYRASEISRIIFP